MQPQRHGIVKGPQPKATTEPQAPAGFSGNIVIASVRRSFGAVNQDDRKVRIIASR